jgi:heme/copper-type cytochrome/quinol oxidase subunit 3
MSTAVATYDPIDVEPAPAPVPARRNVLIVGSLLASAGGAALIGALLGGYFSARDVAQASNQAWPPDTVPLPNVALFVNYIGLLLSGFTAAWALAAIKMDDRRQAYLAFATTIGLGLLFVNGMTFCWSRLAQVAGSSAYATGMYAVTVVHLLMVVAAIAMWVVMAFRVLGGQFDAANTEPIKAALVIWHFVVIAGAVVWWALWFLEGGPG